MRALCAQFPWLMRRVQVSKRHLEIEKEKIKGGDGKKTAATNLSHQSSSVDAIGCRHRAAPSRAVGVHRALLLLALSGRHDCGVVLQPLAASRIRESANE